MGLIGITEGAIPFAAVDPLRVIPSIMVGGAAAGAVGMLFRTADHAPHGGLIVLPVVDQRVGYIISVLVGSSGFKVRQGGRQAGALFLSRPRWSAPVPTAFA